MDSAATLYVIEAGICGRLPPLLRVLLLDHGPCLTTANVRQTYIVWQADQILKDGVCDGECLFQRSLVRSISLKWKVLAERRHSFRDCSMDPYVSARLIMVSAQLDLEFNSSCVSQAK